MNNINVKNEKRVNLVKEIQKTYPVDIVKSIQNTKVYSKTDLILPVRGSQPTEIIFKQMDSVSAVLGYAGEKGKTAVLNFANFVTPGGGFIYGAMAQEEALCLESTLYPVISDSNFASYYRENAMNLSRVGCLYSNRALYSPDIVFFRDGNEERCDVITCAAPNASEYLSSGGSQKMNGNALLDRLSFVIDCAINEGVKTLILGAYGCGVFGQNPVTLGALYNTLLLNRYQGVFDRVVIAVIDEPTLTKVERGYNS